MNEKLAYIAGFIDGEGSISFKLGHRVSINPFISIRNTSFETLLWIKIQLSEINIIARIWDTGEPPKKHWKHQWELYISKQKDILKLLLAIKPYLITKISNANVMIEYINLRKNNHFGSYNSEEINLVNRIRENPIALDYFDKKPLQKDRHGQESDTKV